MNLKNKNTICLAVSSSILFTSSIALANNIQKETNLNKESVELEINDSQNEVVDEITDEKVDEKVDEVVAEPVENNKEELSQVNMTEYKKNKDSDLPGLIGIDISKENENLSKFPPIAGFEIQEDRLVGKVANEYNSEITLIDYDETKYLLSVGLELEKCERTQSYVNQILQYYGLKYEKKIKGPDIEISIFK